MPDIVLDLWGREACFSPPYAKVERLSYPVPTPGAIRGILNSIYVKPSEFFWWVKRIEIMRPILYETCRRNEVISVLSTKKMQPIDVSSARTQRTTAFLFNVCYRVTAEVIPKTGTPGIYRAVYEQALRRIRKGQCFRQPYFGIREFVCHFALADEKAVPEDINMCYGLMPYDMFRPWSDSEPDLSLFSCQVIHGVIDVPRYDSPEVLRMPFTVMPGQAGGVFL